MRIAIVHYSYLPIIAGVELVMAEHARLFAEAGHEVMVVANHRPEAVGVSGGSPAFGSRISKVAVPELGADSELAVRANRELSMGGVGLIFEQAVKELIEVLRPILAAHDVVMLHNITTMHFHLALTAAVWRLADELPLIRFVCWVHDLAACNPDYAPLPVAREPWALLARAHPRCEYVAVSDLRRRQFAELTGQPPDRCRTIPNGVDLSRTFDLSPNFEDLAQTHGLFERDFILLQPARLLRRKNIELTLHVVAALKVAGRSCAALITAPPEVQSGAAEDYAAELRELHSRLGLIDDVFFLHERGPLTGRDMRSLFALADALFFPSWQEGFGIPLLEAALHRLPIFCSEIEPLLSLLPEKVTTFAPDAPPDEVAARIAATLDEDLAHSARRQALRNYSWSAIFGNFLSPLLADLKPPLTV